LQTIKFLYLGPTQAWTSVSRVLSEEKDKTPASLKMKAEWPSIAVGYEGIEQVSPGDMSGSRKALESTSILTDFDNEHL